MEILFPVIAVVSLVATALVAWRTTRALRTFTAQATALQEATHRALDGAVLWCDDAFRVTRFTPEAATLVGSPLRVGAGLRELVTPDRAAALQQVLDGLRAGSSMVVTIDPALGWMSASMPSAPITGRVVRVPTKFGPPYLVALREYVDPRHVSREATAPDVVAQIAHGIAHEFNNLLTTISGRAEMALPHVKGAAAGRSDLEEIQAATVRASALARRLLVLSDAHALQPRIIAANEFVHDIVPTLRQLAGAIPVKLVLSDEAGNLNVDTARMQQVMLAVVQNAIDAIGESGTTVTIRTERRRTPPRGQPAMTDASADFTVILVQDDGPGLSADARSRLFEPFFTTKQSKKGLGLVTAYGIARQSGGTLEVQSTPGHGTSIMLWLPRVSDDADRPLAGRLRPLSESPRDTVLVVEDEESVRRFVRIVLERHGYRVLQAANGIEALRLLEDPTLSLDVLLTDVMMPQMGGRELAERMLAVQPDIAVVFMSGYVADRGSLTGVAERRAPLLQKPFAIDELVRVVQSAISASRGEV